MNRRQALALLLAAAAAAPLHAADFPSRAVTLIIPFPPGGPTDVLGRKFAEALRPVLGQQVVVENRGGAGGNIGAEALLRAAPDGYTVMLGTPGPLAINVSLYRKIGYDPLKSFAPVAMVGQVPNILVVNPEVPARTVQELINHGRANPGKLSYASSGNGASSHLAGVLFNNLAGTDFAHIPYKGTGPALTDLLGGQIAMTFTDVLTALPHIKSGKLRALGVTSKQRSSALPELPTVAEQGLAGFDVSAFFGMVAPAGTPREAVDRLNKALVDVLATPELKAWLLAQGFEAARETSVEQMAAFLAAEVPRWRSIVHKSGAQAD